MSTQPVPQNELSNLYAQKGEIVTQLEIAQSQLAQINNRIATILGLNVQPVQPPQPVK